MQSAKATARGVALGEGIHLRRARCLLCLLHLLRRCSCVRLLLATAGPAKDGAAVACRQKGRKKKKNLTKSPKLSPYSLRNNRSDSNRCGIGSDLGNWMRGVELKRMRWYAKQAEPKRKMVKVWSRERSGFTWPIIPGPLLVGGIMAGGAEASGAAGGEAW